MGISTLMRDIDTLAVEYERHGTMRANELPLSLFEREAAEYHTTLVELFQEPAENIERKATCAERLREEWERFIDPAKAEARDRIRAESLLRQGIERKNKKAREHIAEAQGRLERAQDRYDLYAQDMERLRREGYAASGFAERFEQARACAEREKPLFESALTKARKCGDIEQADKTLDKLLSLESHIYTAREKRDAAAERALHLQRETQRAMRGLARVQALRDYLRQATYVMREHQQAIEDILLDYAQVGTPGDFSQYNKACKIAATTRARLENLFFNSLGALGRVQRTSEPRSIPRRPRGEARRRNVYEEARELRSWFANPR